MQEYINRNPKTKFLILCCASIVYSWFNKGFKTLPTIQKVNDIYKEQTLIWKGDLTINHNIKQIVCFDSTHSLIEYL